MANLLRLNRLVGAIYGTEDFSLFLYSWVKMQRCRHAVELGTGLGVSAFWMAQAMRDNGAGVVTTVDDGSHFATKRALDAMVKPVLREFALTPRAKSPRETYFAMLALLARRLGLGRQVRFVRAEIDPRRLARGVRGRAATPIDLVFSDYAHDWQTILELLGAFLPELAESASVFIDSASTKIASYLALEQTVRQLNEGRIPRTLLESCPASRRRALRQKVERSRFTLVHLVEQKQRPQNSTAWIKIDPLDLVGYAPSLVQG